MLDKAVEHGYTEVSPPIIVRPESMEAAGQYPKFIGDSYETLDREFVLVPTSEVPLVNLHRRDRRHSRSSLRYTRLRHVFGEKRVRPVVIRAVFYGSISF